MSAEMHVLVVWQPLTNEPVAQNAGIQELKACFEGYSWVKPIRKSWLYVVQVDDEKDATELRRALVDVCREHAGHFHLLVSPPMEGGTYHGYLPKQMWAKIRERTNP